MNNVVTLPRQTCHVTAAARRLQDQWRQLALETMEKKALSARDFETLAQYVLRFDPVSATFLHQPDDIRELPMALASFKKTTRDFILREAAKLSISYEKVEERLHGRLAPAVAAAQRDMQKIARWLVAWPVEEKSDYEVGMFSVPRASRWHDDRFSGEPVLVARMNLPMWFRRGQAIERAEDDTVYVMASGYSIPNDTAEERGTYHRSADIEEKTPSFFIRQLCKPALG